MFKHFDPNSPDFRPCWHCTRYAGMDDPTGYTALCTLRNGPRVRPNAKVGCSAWKREPGADDEPGPPAAEVYPVRVLVPFLSPRPAVEWAP